MEQSPSPAKKSSLNPLFVIGLCSSLCLGLSYRLNRDHSSAILSNVELGTLQASKSKNPEVSEATYFQDLSQLVKSQYVEAITDDQTLAAGAVRGMVLSLGDRHSIYRSKALNQIYRNAVSGQFEGIGVTLSLQATGSGRVTLARDSEEPEVGETSSPFNVPQLMVLDVAPGSPAERAGILPGDVIDTVADRWVINQSDILVFQQLVSKFAAEKDKAKRESLNSEIRKMSADLRSKLEKSIMPVKAWEKLMVGQSGDIKVKVRRKGTFESFAVPRIAFKANYENGSNLSIRMVPGDSEKLGKAIGNAQGSLTIDLRHSTNGSIDEMQKCLELVAPKGIYGYILTEKAQPAEKISVSSEKKITTKINLLVDRSTAGAAEFFARMLQSKGLATVTGTMMGDDTVVEDRNLPDGSGYSLNVGKFSLIPNPTKRVSALEPKKWVRPEPVRESEPREVIA